MKILVTKKNSKGRKICQNSEHLKTNKNEQYEEHEAERYSNREEMMKNKKKGEIDA